MSSVKIYFVVGRVIGDCMHPYVWPNLPKEVLTMAKCSICEKAAHFGNAVSHSHRRSNKMWKANVKSVRVKMNGNFKKMYVCTSCLKSGLVERA